VGEAHKDLRNAKEDFKGAADDASNRNAHRIKGWTAPQ
jgi:hypothetical protein